MRVRTRAIVCALLVAVALVVCGCAADGGSSSQSTTDEKPWEAVVVDSSSIKNGKPEAHEWVDDAVKFVQKNAKDEGVLIEVTGMITEGSGKQVDELTIVMPPEDYEGEGDIEVEPGTPCVEVHLAQPYEMTKWTHLIGVRGLAFVDDSQENKIVMVGAIETDD